MAMGVVAELEKHYESSLKRFLGALLELELSMQLVLSFFETKDAAEQDEQELQTTYTLSWEPLLFSLVLVYGHRVAPRFAPAPENEDRNMLRLKILTWVYSLAFLVWDDDMTVKSGPSLGIAIIFCVCDLARFQMEVHRLIDDYTDDEEAPSDVEYAVHMLGLDQTGNNNNHSSSKSMDANLRTSNQGVSTSTWNVPVQQAAADRQGAAKAPVRQSLSVIPDSKEQPVAAADTAAAARPGLQPYKNKSTRYMLKKSSSSVNGMAQAVTPAADRSPAQSEFVAIVDERPQPGAKDEPKTSFVYEF